MLYYSPCLLVEFKGRGRNKGKKWPLSTSSVTDPLSSSRDHVSIETITTLASFVTMNQPRLRTRIWSWQYSASSPPLQPHAHRHTTLRGPETTTPTFSHPASTSSFSNVGMSSRVLILMSFSSTVLRNASSSSTRHRAEGVTLHADLTLG